MVRTKSLNQWPPASLPSHCRIDHGTIGYIHTEWPDEERCPLCRLQSELDAERAAHQATKAELGRLMVALHGDGSSVPGAEDEITALKSRLALAEAVCEWAERTDWTPGGPMWLALAAWRDSRGRPAK